jgi:hypothetical protein
MQGVSFPDINKTPTEQTVAPPCQNTVDEEISTKVVDFMDRNDPKDREAVLHLVQPGAHARHDRTVGQVHGHGR